MGRPKKEKAEKKSNVSLSINPDILESIDKHLTENNISRSEFVEKLWKEYIENRSK